MNKLDRRLLKSHSDVVMVAEVDNESSESRSDGVLIKDEYWELLRRNEIKYEDAYLFEFYDE